MSHKPKLKLKPEILDRKCHLCGHIFTQKSHLVRHQRKHPCQSNKRICISNESSTHHDDLKGIIISLKKQN